MYRKVLVPLDGSELAEHALPHVKELIRGCSPTAKVILLRGIEPLIPIESGRSVEHYDQLEEGHESSMQVYLDKLADDFNKLGTKVKTVLIKITHISIAEEILTYIEENGVDLVVMTTHGRSGFTRWAFGSVADRIIRHAKVPVFIIPPHGARTK